MLWSNDSPYPSLLETSSLLKGVQRIFFRGETEGGPPSTQPQPLGLGLPRARNFLIFNLFKRVFRSLFNAFCSNSSYICLNYRYKFLIYTFSISCLEILGGDGLPPKSLWGETVSLFSPPLCTPLEPYYPWIRIQCYTNKRTLPVVAVMAGYYTSGYVTLWLGPWNDSSEFHLFM